MPAHTSIADTVAFGRQAASRTQASEPERSASGVSLKAAMLVLAGGLMVGSAAFLVSIVRGDPPRLLQIGLGSAQLSVPSPLVRNPSQRHNGAKPRLDLALSWPGLEAARPPLPSASSPDRLTLGDMLLVTLVPADDGLDPSLRPSQLYGRYLESAVEDGPGGLIRRSFRARSPYEGETLFLAPPDGRRFAARCDSGGHAAEGLPDVCIMQMRRGGLDVQLRMDVRLLDQWEAIEGRLQRLLDKMLG